VCGSVRWQIQTDLVFLLTIDGSTVNAGKGQPCVSVICGVCSSVQLFNVFTLGLADQLGIRKGDTNG